LSRRARGLALANPRGGTLRWFPLMGGHLEINLRRSLLPVINLYGSASTCDIAATTSEHTDIAAL